MNTNPLFKQYFGYYIIWTFLHLVFLAIGWNGSYHDYFWPFGGSKYSGTLKEAYDFSEFLVYVIGPIALIIGFTLISEGSIEQKIDEEINKRSQG